MSQTTKLKCKASASLLPNNLTVSKSFIAYAHSRVDQSEIHIIKNTDSALSASRPMTGSIAKLQMPRKTNSTNGIAALRYIHIEDQEMLVVLLCDRSLLLYDAASYKFVASGDTKSDDVSGIASDGTRLFVGTAGGVQVFDKALRKQQNLTTASGGAICDLDCSNGTLAAGDENGTVTVWTGNNGEYQHTQTFETKAQSAVTCLRVSKDGMIVVGYASGHIRLYDNKRIFLEVAAHTRAVTALSLEPKAHTQFVTVSEDTHLNVWSLMAPDSTQKLRLLLSERINQSLLTGVTYCGNTSSLIAITSFDSRFLSVVQKPQ
jgi:WD40 repeat protein